jgi:hypothetical protein
MKPAEKLVGVAMALYADYETGENVRPSNGTIAHELGYSGKAARADGQQDRRQAA